MNLRVFTDGGSLNNPGPSAIGFVIYLDKKIIDELSFNIGHSTNNQAEYRALLAALKAIKKHLNQNIEKVIFYSDSKLMVNQLNGEYKVKKPHLKKLRSKVEKERRAIKKPLEFVYVPREKNRLADSLVKKAFLNR